MALWPSGHMRSHDKLKTKYLLFCNASGHHEGNSPIMSDDLLTTWLREATWQIENLISPILQGLWPPNITDQDLWWEEPTYAVIWSSDNVVMCGHVTNLKRNISSLARPMTMKLGKLMTYGKVNVPMKLHVPLTTWSPEVTWQTKNEILLPPEDVWPPNFEGCWCMVRRSP